MRVIEKYLESTARNQALSVHDYFEFYPQARTQLWSHALCVPIREENENFEKLVDSLSQLSAEKFVVVFVINSRASDSNTVKNSNLQWLKKLMQLSLSFEQHEGHVFGRSQNFDFICINHSQENLFFNDKQGVGHARKVGCDFILQLIQHKKLKSNWIWTSDGDAQLPSKYFEISKNINEKAPAILYPFKHDREQGSRYQKCAISFYEMSLHYYVQGLQWAQSSYAHMSVGSSIAIQANAYAAVRGFPEKLAGEDFYILNKLRKLGKFHIKVSHYRR